MWPDPYDSEQRDPFNYGELYIVWLMAGLLYSRYGGHDAGYLSVENSLTLRQSIDEWFGGLFELATETLADVVEDVNDEQSRQGNTFSQRNFYRSRSDSANNDKVSSHLEHVLQRNRRRRNDPLASLP